MRTQQERDLIVSNLADPYVKENLLSPEDVQELIALYRSQPNKIHKNTGPVTSDVTEQFSTHPVLIKLFDRIKEEIGECKIYTSFFFEVGIPHIIHNDDDKLGPVVYKAITIPLEIAYENENTGYPRLCFFDQYYLEGPSKFFGGAKKEIETYYNSLVYDYTHVQNKSTAPFSVSAFRDHLTHLKPYWLKELSFHSALEWKPSSGLIFDCVRLHCSSDFNSQGIKSKLGLSIFTELPRQ